MVPEQKNQDCPENWREIGAQVTGDPLDIISIKRKKLLEFYAEELVKMFPARENLQFSLVAGAGFEPAAFRL